MAAATAGATTIELHITAAEEFLAACITRHHA
jgi:hypothetical protein